MSKSPALSSPQKTPSPKVQDPSKGSSHDSICCKQRQRQDSGPKMGSRTSRDLSDHPVDFPVGLSPLNSSPPRPRSAPGDLSAVRYNLFNITAIPLHKSASHRPTRGAPSCCVHLHSEAQRGQCQGQAQVLRPEAKGIAEVVKGDPDLDRDKVDTEWLETDEEDEGDDGWSIIIDETSETAEINRALEEPTIRDIKSKPVNDAVVERRKPHLRVHPLFAARYGNDPNWDSMVELGYES
ncbi:uncharacterized protein F4807DRAFT_439026 [Annulohypoxylon truncatum]|uniref:uncharacterized protein n=1 Tax=Annulohypoxylon truncatum TaxID=327061 RepID=UPI0020077D91|nr:uncharacterized protein F4807DRAFT_439026 [Annulohypoxylon truncatum]KAI1206427.1 hypothetical protein F4807DRAFT_439026 [Annulohypoxylon truncatum]